MHDLFSGLTRLASFRNKANTTLLVTSSNLAFPRGHYCSRLSLEEDWLHQHHATSPLDSYEIETYLLRNACFLSSLLINHLFVEHHVPLMVAYLPEVHVLPSEMAAEACSEVGLCLLCFGTIE